MKTALTCSTRNTPWRIAQFLVKAKVKYTLKMKPQQWGQWVRQELTTLGPAFIKMGQFLSTRSDLFDKEVVNEFAKLQDDITPIDISEVHYVINESYGKHWDSVFSHIDPQPIACASIGQVHVATLKDTSTKVVIKVQKPCVAKVIQDDIATLKDMNSIMAMFGGSSRTGEIDNVLKQYQNFLSAELDYTEEMNHMIKFRTMLDDLPVHVPRVYKEFSTNHVLVMEYIPSIKIDNLETIANIGLNTQEIADNLVTIFLQMIVSHGYVHCDPHPGNLGVTQDGEIVLYDFGNVIVLSQEFRKEIKNIIFAVYQKDVDEFVDILLKLKILSVSDDIDTLEIRLFFKSFFDYLQTLDMKALQTSIKNQSIISSYSSNFTKMKVDPDFLALFRVFSLLDGTCSKLDPNFNYIDSISPITQELLSDVGFFDFRIKKDIEKLSTFPKILKLTEQTAIRTQKQVNTLNADVKRLEIVLIGVMLVAQIDHIYMLPFCIGMLMLWRNQSS